LGIGELALGNRVALMCYPGRLVSTVTDWGLCGVSLSGEAIYETIDSDKAIKGKSRQREVDLVDEINPEW